MSNQNNFFSKNLSYLRKEKGMTQTELANRVNVDQTTIGRWEDGNREPTIGNVVNISNVFNIPVTDLLDKDLTRTDNLLSQKEVLFNKTKDILSDSDWATIEFIMNKTIDEYERNKGGE